MPFLRSLSEAQQLPLSQLLRRSATFPLHLCLQTNPLAHKLQQGSPSLPQFNHPLCLRDMHESGRKGKDVLEWQEQAEIANVAVLAYFSTLIDEGHTGKGEVLSYCAEMH